MDIHERLKTARKRAGYDTAADAARRFGWSESTYRSAENGARAPSKKAVAIYARAFRVPPEWILFGTNRSAKRLAHFKGYVNDRAEIYAASIMDKHDDEIIAPESIGGNPEAVVIRTDLLWPRYSDGDILLYSRDQTTLPEDGTECIVMLRDGKTFIKDVRANSDGSYDLESWRVPPLRGVLIEWLSPIIWIRRAPTTI